MTPAAAAMAPAADDALQARLLRLVCGLATALGCGYSAYFAAVGLLPATPSGALCVAISIAATVVARVSGSAERGLDLACILLFATLAAMALLQDGVRSPALWWLPVPAVVALAAGRWRVGALLCTAFAALAALLRAHGAGSWGSVSLLTSDPATQLTLSMTLAALSTALFVALGSRWRSSAAPTANAARALPRDDLVVLVAAADATKRAEVVGMLASLSVTALTVDDGAQAHALLASRRFDAALIDVRLPMLDGLEVARRRRAREAGTLGRRLPIVAMTGIGEVVDMQACAAAGVDDVLSAPFGAADLQLLLSELVGGQRALDDRRG